MNRADKFCALVPAAGVGARMGSATRKPYLHLDAAPLLFHTLHRLRCARRCGEILLAVHPEDAEGVHRQYGRVLQREFGVARVLAGGASRLHTVAAMLRHLRDDVALALVHDGVRPLVTVELVDRVADAVACTGRAAIAALPAHATVKSVDATGRIVSTPPRSRLWMAQTPQVFPAHVLRDAYTQAERNGWDATDDAELAEKAGYEVSVVLGCHDNIKVTTPQDLVVAQVLLQQQRHRRLAGSDGPAHVFHGEPASTCHCSKHMD